MTVQPAPAPQFTFEFACGHEHLDYPEKYCTYPDGHEKVSDLDGNMFDHGNQTENLWWFEDDDSTGDADD